MYSSSTIYIYHYFGGFHKWGYPNSWMVYTGKFHILWMTWGEIKTNLLGKPNISSYFIIFHHISSGFIIFHDIFITFHQVLSGFIMFHPIKKPIKIHPTEFHSTTSHQHAWKARNVELSANVTQLMEVSRGIGTWGISQRNLWKIHHF